MKIFIINGPNINILEKRGESYPEVSLETIKKETMDKLSDTQVEIQWFQSNHEGEIIEKIQELDSKVELLVINPAGFSHTSVAIKDALDTLHCPVFEVHITNPLRRESFRHKMLTGTSANFIMKGFGASVYYLAIKNFLEIKKG